MPAESRDSVARPATPVPDAPDPAAAPPAAPASPTGEITGFHQAVVPQRLHVEAHPTGKRLAFLSLAALGIVYGDIGTSPLYALRECFKPEYHLDAHDPATVYGVLSLILWSLILIVSVKYIVFILKADNRGEGGILALLALLLRHERNEPQGGDRHRRTLMIMLGLFGAALLYGDGVITPAISVLSAVEGLNVKFPALQPPVIVGATLVILFVLFAFQSSGTSRVGGLFGPIMLVWFGTIASLGLVEIVRSPHVLFALNPWYGVRFIADHGAGAFFVLGAVVLCVTGAEALYADMGHFGRRPIRVVWSSVVLPALALNYFGQGALVLRDPSAIENPFFHLAPAALLWPLLVIATLAAIVASQALISGAFSLTQQGIQLGYCPRMTIKHTSYREAGQIYIPEVNKALAAGCFLIVLLFKSSDALGAAYGVAVTGTMVITTILFYMVARSRWHWPAWRIGLLTAAFLVVDLSFLLANVPKFLSGGWVPLAIGVAIFTLMSTWKTGRVLLTKVLHSGALPLDLFLKDVERRKPPRVSGTAVFMTSSADGVPLVLLHHLKHNKVLHERVILMSVLTADVPEIPEADRVTVDRYEHGFSRVTATYGFMETPNIPAALNQARLAGVRAKAAETTFYLGRERVIVADHVSEPARGRRAPEGLAVPHMARWRKKLFIIMSRNARSATEFFGIPPNRVVELGAQVEL